MAINPDSGMYLGVTSVPLGLFGPSFSKLYPI